MSILEKTAVESRNLFKATKREDVSMQNEPTVFVVDDDQAVRDSLCWLIEAAGLNVKACVSAVEFLSLYDPQWPGCLVLDVRLPGMSGLDLQRELQQRQIQIPIIIITGHGDVSTAVRAMKAGAIDFIEKPFSDDALIQRIRDALDRDATARMAQADRLSIQQRIASLTPREKQVLELVVQGKLNKQIAADLQLSQKTVEAHRANLMSKMQATNVADLVKQAMGASIDFNNHGDHI
jgi:two-component system response regulator FixJ